MTLEEELAFICDAVNKAVAERLASVLKELEETQKELNRLKIEHDRLVTEHRALREKVQ